MEDVRASNEARVDSTLPLVPKEGDSLNLAALLREKRSRFYDGELRREEVALIRREESYGDMSHLSDFRNARCPLKTHRASSYPSSVT